MAVPVPGGEAVELLSGPGRASGRAQGSASRTVFSSITSSGGFGARSTEYYRLFQATNGSKLRLLKRHCSSGALSLQLLMFVSCAAGAGEVYAARVRLMEDDD